MSKINKRAGLVKVVMVSGGLALASLGLGAGTASADIGTLDVIHFQNQVSDFHDTFTKVVTNLDPFDFSNVPGHIDANLDGLGG